MSKKTITILVVVAVIGLAIGAYFMFFKKKEGVKTTTTTSTDNTTGLSSLLGSLNLSGLTLF